MRQFSLVIIAAGLAGCSITEPSALRLDLALDKNIVAASDSVRLTLTLSNASYRPIKVLPADAYGICMHAFEAFDAKGHQVSLFSAFCALANFAVPAPRELLPGEHITIVDWWKPGASSLNSEPLSTGIYRLRGRVAGDSRAIYTDVRMVELVPDGSTP